VRGVITGRQVFQNGWTIVREFGPAAYGRCVLAVVTGRPTTFLATVSAPGQPARSLRAATLAALAIASVVLVWSAGAMDVSGARCVATCDAAQETQLG
jgi:hypothetical protein